MLRRHAAAVFALWACGATPAFAQAAICVFGSAQDGELALTANLMGWRTSRPAAVQVINVLPATLFLTPPVGWAASPARAPATTFGLSAAFSGANLGQLLPNGGGLSGVLSVVGTTTTSVSLSAAAAAPYPAGAYAAEVTVTCAPR